MQENRLSTFVTSLCALLTITVTSCRGPTPTPRGEPEGTDRPNVLLIVADDLGYSDLGCYGGEISTPHLDRLAANGARLTRFYTSARCCPSRASLLSGQYPHRVGLGHMTKDIGQEGYRGRIADEAVTVGEALAESGYRTFLSGKWHLGTDDPTERGFEEFYGTLVSAKTFWRPEHYQRLPQGRHRREYPKGDFYGTDALTDHALDFLELARRSPDRPWFLYLAYNAPHFPLQAPRVDIARYADRYHSGWDALRRERLARMKRLGLVPDETSLPPRSKYWDWAATQPGVNPAWESLPSKRRADLARRMAIYAAMVDRMDRNIGRLLADLESRGELDNTLIVFLSDNGACAEWDELGFDGKSSPHNELFLGEDLERMGEPGTFHSVGSGWANASNTPWRLYKHFTHEGGIASPCIVHWPSGIEGRNAVFDTPSHLIDWMPTILEATSARYPRARGGHATPALPGRSLLPLLRGQDAAPRTLFFEHEGNRAVIEDRWKLVAVAREGWELYDTARDRTEQRDLSRQHPAIVRDLADSWSHWAREQNVTPLPSDYGVEYLPARSAEDTKGP